MKLKVNTGTNLPSSQFFKTAKTTGGQCLPLINGIMNSENASNEMVKSFIDLANMAKEVMDENQQPSAQQYLEKLFPSTRGRGRVDENIELYTEWVQVNHLLLEQLIQILVLQHRLPQNKRLQKYGN